MTDEARRGRVEAPDRRISTDSVRDLIAYLTMMLLAVIAIAILSANDRMRRDETPVVEYVTIAGSVVVFAVVVLLDRRRRR